MQLIAPSQVENPVYGKESSLFSITHWINHFLARPHQDLGRAGLVCPFIPRSLKMDTIRLVEVPASEMTQQGLEDFVKQCRETFLQQSPQTGKLSIYKALLLVFPDINDDQCGLIDNVQRNLKPFFVEKGLMLGEFHKFNDSPGLHNPNFYPLRSPIPMLAIRFMTESDLPFLSRMTDNPHTRIHYLQSYINCMGNIVKDSSKFSTAYEALAIAREEAKRESVNQSFNSNSALDVLKDMKTIPSKCPIKRLTRWLRKGKRSISSKVSYFLCKLLPALSAS